MRCLVCGMGWLFCGLSMAQPDIKGRMVAQGADPAYLGADDFARYLQAEMPRWAEVVKSSGARLD